MPFEGSLVDRVHQGPPASDDVVEVREVQLVARAGAEGVSAWEEHDRLIWRRRVLRQEQPCRHCAPVRRPQRSTPTPRASMASRRRRPRLRVRAVSGRMNRSRDRRQRARPTPARLSGSPYDVRDQARAASSPGGGAARLGSTARRTSIPVPMDFARPPRCICSSARSTRHQGCSECLPVGRVLAPFLDVAGHVQRAPWTESSRSPTLTGPLPSSCFDAGYRRRARPGSTRDTSDKPSAAACRRSLRMRQPRTS